MERYHDREWGVPEFRDRRLFEFLVLEGAQAGLSWETILRKRPAYRAAYERFDPRKVARFSRKDTARLLRNPGIVRNRLKIESSVTNARLFLEAQEEHGRFADYLWSFVGGVPRQNRVGEAGRLPATSEDAVALSRDLRRRGFRFVGPTIVYAFMQAVGLVNDHAVTCFRYGACARAPRR
jgi:DNA-3-methyladenine glycosylase I